MDRSLGDMRTEAGGLKTEDVTVSLGDRNTQGSGGLALGRIDQYELLRELGGGGFGTVYLARDTVAGIDVAVKGLPPLVKNNAEELERIRENFALVSKLHHPNIAAALHLHPAKDVSYADERARQALRVMPGDTLMVMAYAPGVTLTKWRKQFPGGKVPVDQALEVCRQIAAALDYAHGERVVHRDVKPSNVMVETREKAEGGRRKAEGVLSLSVKVLDFGLAAEIRSSMGRVSQEKGDTSGTRPYMAPEQWAGKRQDGRTDQYALAALFYELVSGAVPFASAFDTGDPVIMANAAEKKVAEPLPELSKAQNAALLRGLAKEPAERFATCRDLVSALGGRAAPRAAAGDKPRIPRMARMGLAAAALVIGAYGAYDSCRTYVARRAAASAAAERAATLDAAQRAKAAELRTAAEAALASGDLEALEAGNAEAAALKREAEGSLTPVLTVECEVPGARVSCDGQTYDAPHTFDLKRDSRYSFTVSVPSNNSIHSIPSKRYKPATLEVTADWRGPKTRRVTLDELKGPAEGQPWTSPATGMEFVWVPALKLWVGKYEVTNDEYRKQTPDHDSIDYLLRLA